MQSSLTVIQILTNTLFQLEQTSEYHHDDSAVLNLKRQLVRMIAELEVEKAERKVLQFPATDIVA